MVGNEGRPRTTALRPDVVMWYYEGKKAILVELTVPWEVYRKEAEERTTGR